MIDLSWIFGRAKSSYTSSLSPIPLTTKSGQKTTLLDIAHTSIPPCRLNPFLFNGHLQTIFTVLKSSGPPIFYKRKIFDSTHSIYEGQFAVDFVVSEVEGLEAERERKDSCLPERTTFFTGAEWENIGSDDDRPMLVALHGLSGGSHEVYLRETLAPLHAKGWAACVVNGRGCAMSKLTTPQLFNSRATWDVRQTIQCLRRLFPNRPLYGVGFSLGANIITNYCGEEGASCVLKGVVVNSNPWNLEISNSELKRTWIGLEGYHRAMGKNMMGLYEKHKEQILQNSDIDPKLVAKTRYLYEFDRYVQCPTWGYPTESAYYRDAQSADALLAVRVPFLGINAEDDPISSKLAIPYEEFKQNPYTILCTTSLGGHLGSFQLGGGRWFATATASFLLELHREIDTEASSTGNMTVQVDTPEKKFPIFDANNRRLILPDA